MLSSNCFTCPFSTVFMHILHIPAYSMMFNDIQRIFSYLIFIIQEVSLLLTPRFYHAACALRSAQRGLSSPHGGGHNTKVRDKGEWP